MTAPNAMEHALLVGFANQVMGKLFLEMDGKIKQLNGVRFQSESLRRELNMLVAYKIDELRGRRDGRPQAVEREHGEQIRELIHDIEDCIERFLHRITCEQETGIVGVFHRVVHKVKTLGIRNRFAKEMEKLKKRLMELSSAQSRNPVTLAQGEPRSLPTENNPVGITKAVQYLLKLLEEPDGQANKLRVISIFGFGGSGKTTLANAVFKTTAALHPERFPLRAWVRRSHYNDVSGLLRKIIKEFWGASGEEATGGMDQWGLQDYVDQNLSEQRFLIVFVDIDIMHWYWIQSTFKNKGQSSRIIVTTTKLSSAKTCSGADGYVYQIRNLGRDVSEKIALGNQQNAGDPASRKALVDKCDGHPLALVSVANHISGGIMSSPNRQHCTELCDRLGSFLHAAPSIGADHFVDLRGVLMNNYTSLCYCTIQPSLLYLGIFGDDCGNLNKKKITRRWVAEGYARSTDPRRNEEKVAEENFMGFIDLNVIQPVGVSSSKCKALSIVHEFVVDKSISDNFVMPFNAPERRTNNGTHGHEEKVRHLFVSDHSNAASSGRTLNMDLSRVRSLTVFSKSAGGSFSKFSQYRLMRVLDVENCTEVNRRQLRSICRLWNLRYLTLKDNIKKLPRSIDRLKLLEALTVSKNEVTELPVEVLGMPCLIHLTGKFMLPEKLPEEQKLKKLCEASRLKTLAGFIAIRNQAFLQLMGQSKNLTKVKVWYESTGEVGDINNKLNDAIKEYSKAPLGHGDARSLSIDFQTCAQRPHLPDGEGIKYHLSSMKLRGDLSTVSPQFGTFLLSVDGLTDLCLSLTLLTPELLSAVSGMSYLVHLKLIADKVAEDLVIIEIGQLKWLQRLYFVVTKPDSVIPPLGVHDGYFPELVSLQLLSKHLGSPLGIEIKHLTKLQEIELHDEVSEPARQEWETAARNHCNRPNVLPFKCVDDPAESMTLPLMVNNPVAGPAPVVNEQVVIENQVAREEQVADVPAVVPDPVVAPATDVPPDVVASAVHGEDPVASAVLVATVLAEEPVSKASPADDSATSYQPSASPALMDLAAVTATRELAIKDEASLYQVLASDGSTMIMAQIMQRLGSCSKNDDLGTPKKAAPQPVQIEQQGTPTFNMSRSRSSRSCELLSVCTGSMSKQNVNDL